MRESNSLSVRISRRILKFIILVFVIFLPVSSGFSQEQNSTEATQENPPLKIGYINANLVIDSAPQTEQAFENLQNEFAERQEALNEIGRQLDEVRLQLEIANNESLTEEKIRELQRKERNLARSLERRRSELNEDFNYRRNEELEKLQNYVSDVIVKMAHEQKFDLIVQSPVVWASERINLTDDVVRLLNENFQK